MKTETNNLQEEVNNLWKKNRTIAVVCNQWGDTGKGKITDLLAQAADIIVRTTGGENAGHTIRIRDKEYVFHLLPSGILAKGKINIIGNGTAIYPRTLLQEMELVDSQKLKYNLKLAYNAKLVLPHHILLDRLKEFKAGKNKIGTTGKGNGETYNDHVNRVGFTLNAPLNPVIFKQELRRFLAPVIKLLKLEDPKVIRHIMSHPHLEKGRYYNPKTIFNIKAIVEQYLVYYKKLKPLICDTDAFVRKNVGKNKILLEGAQGLLLSINHGSRPFVTSSDCSIYGVRMGAGLPSDSPVLVFGIIKGFYLTRVGNGPFPTEMGGKKSDRWCNSGRGSREKEEKLYKKLSLNECNDFERGVLLRWLSGEYGATTGRPRRIGWLDLPLLRYAVQFNGPDVILTKLDVLSGLNEIKICTHYIYQGDIYWHGNKQIKRGDIVRVAIMDNAFLKKCEPVYKEFKGWQEPLRYFCSTFEDLPKSLGRILNFVAKQTGIKPRIISVGPDRNETIFL